MRTLLLLFSAILFGQTCSAATGTSYATSDGRFTYTLTDGTATITQYTPASDEETSVIIPSSLGGRPVVELGATSFGGQSKLASVSIPGSVKTIGNRAFYGCGNLTSINLNEGIEELGRNVFAGLSKAPGSLDVILPGSLRTVGRELFYNSRNLRSIVCKAPLSGDLFRCFSGCANLERATLAEGQAEIGQSMFYD